MNLKKNKLIKKKGFMAQGLKSYSMILIVLIVLAGLVAGITVWTYGATIKERCSMSVWIGDKLNEVWMDWPLDCPAPHSDITTKKEVNTYEEVATQLKTCWEKTGQGNQKVDGSKFWSSKDLCLVCSSFTVEKDVDWDKFVKFMAAEPVPLLDGITFSDYIDTSTKKAWTSAKLDSAVLNQLNGNRAYYADMAMLLTDENPKILRAKDQDDNPITYWVVFFRDPNTDLVDFFRGADRFLISINPLIWSNVARANMEAYRTKQIESGGLYELYVTSSEKDFVDLDGKIGCQRLYWVTEDFRGEDE